MFDHLRQWHGVPCNWDQHSNPEHIQPCWSCFWQSYRTSSDVRGASLNERINQLIHNHRVRGHIIASVNPLGVATQKCPPELELAFYNFSEEELNLLANSPAFPSETPLTLREIFQRVRDTYCRSIGVQFMHIDNLSVRQWLQHRMERTQNRLAIPATSNCEFLHG